MKSAFPTLLLFFASTGSPLAAQEPSPLAQSQSTSPEASLEDVRWLIGGWEGYDTEGDRVVENWRAPIGGLMVGTFIQTARNAAGAEVVEATEHMHLWEEDGTLKFASMSIEIGSEPIIGPRTVTAIEPCAIHFDDMVMQCRDSADPAAGLIVTYGEDDPKAGARQYVIMYEKAGDN